MQQRAWDRAARKLEELRDFFHGYDYAEDALDIADLVASGAENESTAEYLLYSMGWLAGMITDWKINTETIERARQIRSLAIPGYGEQEGV